MSSREPAASSPSISRRHALQMLGVGGLALVGGGSLLRGQATPAAATRATAGGSRPLQGAGAYHFKVGDIECALVSDGGFTARPSDLFPDVGDDELAEACDKVFLAPGFVPMSISALLVRVGDAVVLLDTGGGDSFSPTTGKLTLNLAAAGVTPEQVTHVIVSHVHPDHAGGLVTADGASRFRNARIIVSEAEHAFWTGASPRFPANTLVPPPMQQGVTATAQKLLAAVKGQIELKRPGDTILGKLTLVDVAGHTPGMVATRIGSGADTLTYVADTAHVVPIQMAHPTWKLLFDADPDAGAKTREKLYAQLAKDRTLVAGPHVPWPGLGHVARDGTAGFRWVPRLWEW